MEFADYKVIDETVDTNNLELLQEKVNKLKEELEKDKIEQFDDYVIYLIEKYLKILGEE